MRLGWRGRTQVERVELYTVGTLYLLFWLLLAMGLLSAVNQLGETGPGVGLLVGSVVLGTAGTFLLRDAIELHPDPEPVPWRSLGVLVALSIIAEGLVFLLPEEGRFAASLLVLGPLVWGAGGLTDRRIQIGLYVAAPLVVLVATGSIGLAVYGLGFGMFLIFTVRSSLWLLGVVNELDRGRATQAALAVAEERLRFSRDVHDVLGRRLSTIAVQAELAARLVERADERGPQTILEVRETAHEALREARELARGYRPLDLATEVDGAVALLRSAGIDATADLGDLPEAWHEPVARVIREAVTNALRHSQAQRVTMTYAEREVVIRNDGVTGAVRTTPGGGTGLAMLAEQLEPLGLTIVAGEEAGEFVVRLRLPAPDRVGEKR